MRKRAGIAVLLGVLVLCGLWSMGCIGNRLNAINVAGSKRYFLLHLPPALDRTKSYPLVLALHQFSDTPEGTERLTDFSKLADREGFLVAYPKGEFPRTWNPGMRSGPDDVAFLNALVDDLAKNYPVDTKRVYACGLSAGGMMSQWLACKSDRFAAVAALAGSLTQAAADQCPEPSSVPVLLMHGSADPVVPYGGGETSAGPGMKPTFLSAEDGAKFWANKAGCTGEPAREELPVIDNSDSTRVVKYTYPCTAPMEVLRYEITGGGHTWPGHDNWYPAFIVGSTSNQIDATQEIWEFFKRHAKN